MFLNNAQEVKWGHIYPFIRHLSAFFISEITEQLLIKSGIWGLLQNVLSEFNLSCNDTI
jgi:hypothetical protein